LLLYSDSVHPNEMEYDDGVTSFLSFLTGMESTTHWAKSCTLTVFLRRLRSARTHDVISVHCTGPFKALRQPGPLLSSGSLFACWC
jgi:hypothetical protein